MCEPLSVLCLAAQDVLLLSRAAAAAIRDGGDLKATLARLRTAYDRLRLTTSRLGGQDIPPTRDNLAALLSLRLSMLEARKHASIVRRWLERHDDPDFVADALLGVCWERRRDPVVLLGDDTSDLVAQLRARGQERIIVCASQATAVEGATVVVTSPFEVRAAVLCCSGDQPARAATIKRCDDAVTKETVIETNRMVQEALDGQRMCANTIDVFGAVWIKQGIANLPVIAAHPTIDLLRDSFAGLPAVIIASGPSLTRNIDQLKALKGRALLITFSHSLGACRRAGLVPDLVLALDPEDLRYHYDGTDMTQPEASLLGATIHPGVMRLPTKRLFTFAANNTIDSWIYHGLDVNPMVATGGSVATSALALAISWRCSPIVFVGQDLSYPGGEVYAKGISDDQARIVKRDGHDVIEGWSAGYAAMATVGGQGGSAVVLREVDDWHGTGKVPTSFQFDMYRRWMENVIKQFKITAWNCTEGGARIDGCEHITLEAAIAKLPTVDARVGERLDAVAFDRAASEAKMRSHLRVMSGQIQQAGELARQCTRLFHACTPAGARGARRAMRKASRKIQAIVDQMPYLVLANQAHLHQRTGLDPIETPDEWNAGASANYQLVLESVAAFGPLLDAALEELTPAHRRAA